MTPQLALGGIAALALLPAVLWLVERLLRDPVLGAGIVLGLAVFSSLTEGVVPPVSIGGAVILDRDVLFSLLVGAGTLRLLRRDGFSRSDRLVVLLIALIAWSALRGIPAAGLEPALRETRIFLYYFGGVLYVVALRPSPGERDRIAQLWVRAAIGFAAVVLIRWAALAVGLQSGLLVRSQEPGVRVIDAQNALVIAEAIMFLTPAMLRRTASDRQRWTVGGLLVVLIGLQHRTIWVVLLLGVTVAGLRFPNLARRFVAAIMAVCMTSILMLVVWSGSGQQAVVEEPTAIQQNPLDDGSILWRVDGWRGLLTQRPDNAMTLAVGEPMGSGYARVLQTSGVVRDTSPHNFYIQTYLRLGIVGLAAFIYILYSAIAELRRPFREPQGRWAREGLLLALTIHATFMLAWGPSMEQGLLLGLGLVAAGATPSSPSRLERTSTPVHAT